MKCPHCGQEHPDIFQFCPVTGNKIEKVTEFIACSNAKCPDFGKKILPIDSRFCPTCDQSIAKCKRNVDIDKTIKADIDLVHILKKKIQKRIVEILN